MGHGFGCVDGSWIDWHQRHVVRVFLLPDVWQSGLRGVRSCDGRHVPVLAWVCLSYSLQVFDFRF